MMADEDDLSIPIKKREHASDYATHEPSRLSLAIEEPTPERILASENDRVHATPVAENIKPDPSIIETWNTIKKLLATPFVNTSSLKLAVKGTPLSPNNWPKMEIPETPTPPALQTLELELTPSLEKATEVASLVLEAASQPVLDQHGARC
jgi:hypothetical protein